MPDPSTLAPATVLADNSGRYMSPYTSDGVLALWVDAVMAVRSGTLAGEAAGIVAGSAATGNSGIGSVLGEAAGGTIGRVAALNAIGGEQALRDQSDLSFREVEDLAIYLYRNHADSPYYDAAVEAASVIYPDLTPRKNLEYIVYAPRR